jgi:hypothetical protein
MSTQVNESNQNSAQPTTPGYEPVPSDTIYMVLREEYLPKSLLKKRDIDLKENLKQNTETKLLYFQPPGEKEEFKENPEKLTKMVKDLKSDLPKTPPLNFLSTNNYNPIEKNLLKQAFILGMVSYEIEIFIESLELYSKQVKEGKKNPEPENQIPYISEEPNPQLSLIPIYSQFLNRVAHMRLYQTSYLMASPYKEYHEYHIPRKPIPTDPNKMKSLFDMVEMHYLEGKKETIGFESIIILLSMKKDDYQAFVNDLRQTIYLQAHELYKSLDNQLLFDYEHRLPQDLKI